MPTCARCGAYSPENAIICQKCSVPFASQLRGQAGAARQKTLNIVRYGIWALVLIVVAAVTPSIYHAGNGAYQKFHYDSVTANATQSCGGPITDSTQPYQKTEIADCLAKNEDLQTAKAGYAAFVKSEKH